VEDWLSEPSSPLLSVRGEARRSVMPDAAVLAGAMWGNQPSKAEVLAEVSARWDRLIADLGAAGGVPLGIGTDRVPLTWSAQSTTTHPQSEFDRKTGQAKPSGRVIAVVHAMVTVRAFDRLEDIDAILARHEGFNVHGVTWSVDLDNPAWPEVRAAAIEAAIAKGRDYAAALGGSLQRIDHLADVGLIGERGAGGRMTPAGSAMVAASGAPDMPSLDPVPQEIQAAVEARFTAIGVQLPAT
jgi:uncharacterized protein YggE